MCFDLVKDIEVEKECEWQNESPEVVRKWKAKSGSLGERNMTVINRLKQVLLPFVNYVMLSSNDVSFTTKIKIVLPKHKLVHRDHRDEKCPPLPTIERRRQPHIYGSRM